MKGRTYRVVIHRVMERRHLIEFGKVPIMSVSMSSGLHPGFSSAHEMPLHVWQQWQVWVRAEAATSGLVHFTVRTLLFRVLMYLWLLMSAKVMQQSVCAQLHC
jgi:hypothetical protein